MSVLNKIVNGEYEVILLNQEGFSLPQTVEFKQLSRLLKLGAEAERASNGCNICGDRFDETPCGFNVVCKMVREGNHG